MTPAPAIAVAGYAVQVIAAQAWMQRPRFGPAEWLWRSLTYRQRQPFRVVGRRRCRTGR